jgi:glycosyltransferase involved in cell wall biosynthesis
VARVSELGQPVDIPTVDLGQTDWPSVGVVIATRNRPNLVRRALDSVTAQDYPGPLRVVVVFDDTVPDWTLSCSGDRPVLVLENWRTTGLAGARNTGILAAADCDWVAFCDDDDTWDPAKLTAQLMAMSQRPGSQFGTCAAEVEYDGRRTARLVGRGPVTLDVVSHGRGRRLPASGFVARHDVLARSPERGGVGLLDESGPAGAAEWDLLMRAARRAPIVHLDQPLVRVLWRRPDADPTNHLKVLRWMNAHHPELREDRRHAARNLAEIACWEAAAGNRRRSLSCARAALRTHRAEPLALLALAAAVGLARGRRLLGLLRHDHLR